MTGGDGRGPTVARLQIADDPAAWVRAGFALSGAGTVCVGSTAIELVGASEPRGIRRWALTGEVPAQLDGLPTSAVSVVNADAEPGPDHPNGVVAVDHIVVGSPHRERTVAALREGLGIEPRRQTEHELYGRAMVQTFYLLGDLVLEVISRPDEASGSPAVFWGLAFVVADLATTARVLGDHLGGPRDAVQPGRRIATLRGDDLGISVPLAFLTPRG